MKTCTPTPATGLPRRSPAPSRPATWTRACAAVGLALAASLLTGCASGITWGVEPWERDLLAKPEMQPGGDALQGAYDDHIYFSKEAATGGRGFGGGGCGCN